MSLDTKTIEFDRTQILFEKKRYAAQLMDDRIGAMTRSSLRYDENEDFQMDVLVKRVCVEVLTRKLVNKVYEKIEHVKVPENWWEHWKQDHAPNWLRKRWPVMYETKLIPLRVEFERYATYPEADIVLPDRFGTMYLYETAHEITKRERIWN